MNKAKIITNLVLSLLGISAITGTTVLATNDNVKEVEAKTNLLSNNLKRANNSECPIDVNNYQIIDLLTIYKDDVPLDHFDENVGGYTSGYRYNFLELIDPSLVKEGYYYAVFYNLNDSTEYFYYPDSIYSGHLRNDSWDYYDLDSVAYSFGYLYDTIEELDDIRAYGVGPSNDNRMFLAVLAPINKEYEINTYKLGAKKTSKDITLFNAKGNQIEGNEALMYELYNDSSEQGEEDIIKTAISDASTTNPKLIALNVDNTSYIDSSNIKFYSKNDLAIYSPSNLWFNYQLQSDGIIAELDSLVNKYNFFGLYTGGYFNINIILDSMFDGTPSINNLAIYDLKVNDLQEPTISGENHFVVNVNNPLSKEEILSHISAYDETDGKVAVVFDSCDYDPSNLTLGQFDAVVSATDSSGNKATINITINVVDIDKPVINGTNSYEVSYDEPLTLDSIKQALTVTDNFEKNLVLDLVEDNYTGHEREVGEHTIKFNAKDSSDNVSDNYTVTIKVIDKKTPVITAPKTITAGNDKMVSLDEIKAKISVNDGLDGNITNYEISGFDNYETNYKKVGSYVLTVKASDKSGNQATFEITINVEDRIAPDIYFDDYFIVVPQGQELSKEQIYEMASKVLNIAVSEFSSLEGEYNTAVAGNYKLILKTLSNESYNFTLSVEANYEDTTLYRDLAWYEYIYIWFSIFFNFQDGYETESFWDFGIRCSYISEVYSSGKIKVTEQVNDEVVSDVEAIPNDEESAN